ncbi:MAG: membrane-targeted effector domain-containing toxin [Chlamydiota bacterium]
MISTSQDMKKEALPFTDLMNSPPMVFSFGGLPFPKNEKEEVFRIVMEKLLAYEYATAEFDEQKYTFKLYHQENEIQSMIVHLKLDQYFYPKGISYTESPLNTSFCARNVIMRPESSGYKVFKKAKMNLLAATKPFYASRKGHTVTVLDHEQVPEAKVFSSFLKQYEGICIGEYCDTGFNPKARLIENMKELYNLGVRTLYLQGIFYDSMYADLAYYRKIPPHIELYLRKLDCRHGKSSEESIFLSLIRKAHQVGIDVVPIDTSLSFACGKHRKLGVRSIEDRVKAMNFVATRIIEEEQKKVPGKYVALMGITHLVEYIEDVPGVSELLGVPSLLFQDGKYEMLNYNESFETLRKPVSLFLQRKACGEKKKEKRKRLEEEEVRDLKRAKNLEYTE